MGTGVLVHTRFETTPLVVSSASIPRLHVQIWRFWPFESIEMNLRLLPQILIQKNARRRRTRSCEGRMRFLRLKVCLQHPLAVWFSILFSIRSIGIVAYYSIFHVFSRIILPSSCRSGNCCRSRPDFVEHTRLRLHQPQIDFLFGRISRFQLRVVVDVARKSYIIVGLENSLSSIKELLNGVLLYYWLESWKNILAVLYILWTKNVELIIE